MPANKILAADAAAEYIGEYLESSGYRVITADKDHEMLGLIKSGQPSLVVLGCEMPESDGKSLCARIREISGIPVIVISESGDITDKIAAFEAGADDYLVRPFDMRELQARIKAVLRRAAASAADSGEIIVCGNMEINITNYELKIDSVIISIPPKELELLYYFASNPDRVFTREQLLEQVWGFDHFGDLRTVDVHIKRLRTKIEKSSVWSIITVWGVGYKFGREEAEKQAPAGI